MDSVKKKGGSLSREDKKVLDAVEEAGSLYERYLELTRFTASLSTLSRAAPEPAAPNWDSPLTLVVGHSL